MAFTGLSAKEGFNASLLQEDVSQLIRMLSPKETPILDWLGDGNFFATQLKHEYIEDYQLPNYIVASTAIGSDTAATAFRINGLGLALNYGQLLENESAAPEVMQINSIYGANSIGVTRNYDGGGVGSLAAGGQLYVRAAVGIEGADHGGGDTRRLGQRSANTVGLFRMELAESATVTAANLLGTNSWEARKAKALKDIMHQLEKEVVRGKWNTTNSLGTVGGQDRTMRGIRTQLATVNSTIVSNSFVANPHLYVGNLWQQIFNNGASQNTETWGLIAGPTWYKALSDLNDTKVQDSNQSTDFQRVIRRYTGPFGSCELFLSRVLQGGPSGSNGAELLLVPRERLQVGPLQGRSFSIEDMGKMGDNKKALVTGEYTLELYHEAGMAHALGS